MYLSFLSTSNTTRPVTVTKAEGFLLSCSPDNLGQPNSARQSQSLGKTVIYRAIAYGPFLFQPHHTVELDGSI